MSDTFFLCDVVPGTLLLNQSIPNTRDGGYHRHLVDIYIPNVPLITRGLVLLHGGGGTKENIARQATIVRGTPPTPKKVNWSLLSYWKVAVAVPQGQACVGVDPAWGAGNNPWNPHDADTRNTKNPNGVFTWSNNAMWSGVDDPQFLKDLVTYMKASYWGSNITKLDVAGHSNGGMMAWRAWFEFNSVFDHYLCVSGPPSKYYDSATVAGVATGGSPKPVWMQFGQQDTVLDITGGPAGAGNHFQDSYWIQNPTQLSKADVTYPSGVQWTSGWRALQRALALSGDGTTINYADGVPFATALGSGLDWRYGPGGTYKRFELRLLSYPGHPMYLQQQAMGKTGGRIFGKWMTFATNT